jgi:hypothetical protein
MENTQLESLVIYEVRAYANETTHVMTWRKDTEEEAKAYKANLEIDGVPRLNFTKDQLSFKVFCLTFQEIA